MNKVISFSLWGTQRMYLTGAVKNAELREKIYPGWKMRFYTDVRMLGTPEVRRIIELGCDVLERPACDSYMGLFWRMEIGYDNEVDRFIIRDTDSRINVREAAAVKEWEQTGFPLHLMRDHWHWHNVYIMGGMWGAVKNWWPEYKHNLDHYVQNCCVEKPGKGFWGNDQNFLHQQVWPRFRLNHLCHDDIRRVSRHEQDVKAELKFRVPLPRKQFVGQVWDESNKPVFPGA